MSKYSNFLSASIPFGIFLLISLNFLTITTCLYGNPIWESFYQTTPLIPDHDEDGDGLINKLELIAGTDPNDPTDTLRASIDLIEVSTNIVRIYSPKSRTYQLETRNDIANEWTAVLAPFYATYGEKEIVVPSSFQIGSDIRLVPHLNNQAEIEAQATLAEIDTDGDSHSDIIEYLGGINAFNTESTVPIPKLLSGPYIKLEWDSKIAKSYQIQVSADLESESWTNLGEPRFGTSTRMTAVFSQEESLGRFFRIAVTDLNSEISGLNKWELFVLGLDDISINEALRTEINVEDLITATPHYEITVADPVINSTRTKHGSIRINRKKGFGWTTFSYTTSGTASPDLDYISLPGTIQFGPHEDQHDIRIELLPSYDGDDKFIEFNFFTDASSFHSSVRINLTKENRIVVTEYGATGNGVTDDTIAIQNAILALQNSSQHNTLFFPSGIYKLGKLTRQTFTPGNHYTALLLGSTDLSGRDIFFSAEEGATLLSTPNRTRSHILVARGRSRSLHFYDLRFEKEPTALSLISPGSEPNGAYGVAFADYYSQEVDQLSFIGCNFYNCHGAVRTFGDGLDIWGKLKNFRMIESKVINPYGSNTVEGKDAYGGGQQVNLTPWVGSALYENNTFVGGPDNPVDTIYNPDGIPKDGSHFGSPLRLEFKNNIVRNMGVEAIFQTSDPLVAWTRSSFIVPQAGTLNPAYVTVGQEMTTIQPGQILNFRSYRPGETVNCILSVHSYDPSTRTLVIINHGASDEDISAWTISSSTPIFLQFSDPTNSVIEGNVVTSAVSSTGIGIVSKSKSLIRGNFISGYLTGVNLKPEDKAPLSPPSIGSVISDNIIYFPEGSHSPHRFHGIVSWTSKTHIKNNLILLQKSFRGFGILARGESPIISNNQLGVREMIPSYYDSPNRLVGIGFSPFENPAIIQSNSTHGFDIGVGPVQAHQPAPYLLSNHHSSSDVMEHDPNGFIPE